MGDAGMSDADLGVTPGGAQDVGLAREIIEAGGIPSADAYTASGLFSEHDLPFPDAECEQILCPRAAAALTTPLDADDSRMLVQFGFDTRLTADTFEREDLNLSVALDVSGSMQGEKIGAVRRALDRLVAQLHDGDRLSLVLFNSGTEVALEPTVMDASGRDAALLVIARIEADGSTNINAGLSQSYDLVAEHLSDGAAGDRVMLFTDAQPNVGETSAGSFVDLARTNADRGVGLTVFGVGLDLDAELVTMVSEVRGGNAFTLWDVEDIESVFDEDFAYLVTPLAYDFEVTVEPASGWRFTRGFGAAIDGPDSKLELGATTLFLSSGGGGMALELEPSEGLLDPFVPLGEIAMSLEEPDGTPLSDSLTLSFDGGAAFSADVLGEEGPRADGLGVFKIAGLVDELAALDAGAAFCEGKIEAEAAEVAREAAHRLGKMAAEIDDADLDAESLLMAQLGENITDGGREACW